MQPQGRFVQRGGDGGQGGRQRGRVEILHEQGAGDDQGNDDAALDCQCSNLRGSGKGLPNS